MLYEATCHYENGTFSFKETVKCVHMYNYLKIDLLNEVYSYYSLH